MPYCTIDSRKLFFVHQSGRADRPVLVLLHGAGGRHSDWPAKIRHLPQTAVYTLDLPGHARSDGDGHNSIDGYTDDILRFIHTQQLTNVILVGHSMGGAIAQTAALRHPPEIVGLVLVGTSAALPVGGAILNNILPNFQKAVNIISKYGWSRHAQPLQVGLAKRLLAETRPEVLYGDFAACNQFDVRQQLDQIMLPTLVISGAEDQMTPAKNGRFLANNLPHSHYVEIPRAGHFLMLERPDPVAKAITTFLDNTIWPTSAP